MQGASSGLKINRFDDQLRQFGRISGEEVGAPLLRRIVRSDVAVERGDCGHASCPPGVNIAFCVADINALAWSAAR